MSSSGERVRAMGGHAPVRSVVVTHGDSERLRAWNRAAGRVAAPLGPELDHALFFSGSGVIDARTALQQMANGRLLLVGRQRRFDVVDGQVLEAAVQVDLPVLNVGAVEGAQERLADRVAEVVLLESRPM